mgnify:CR=1 FL=1
MLIGAKDGNWIAVQFTEELDKTYVDYKFSQDLKVGDVITLEHLLFKEGYAKIKRLPGLAIVTSGPGGTNLVTPVANCFYESIPCIFISGQINSKFLRPHKSIRQVGFQETDIISMVKPITKYAKIIMNPNEIIYELEKAYSICNSGRKGPVFLDIPLDVQKAHIKTKDHKGVQKKFDGQVFDLKKARLSIKKYLKDNPQTVIALAYFDVDLYKPTKDCLLAIEPYLTKGSVIGFDEPNSDSFPGETIAIREVFGSTKYKLYTSKFSAGSGYLIIE